MARSLVHATSRDASVELTVGTDRESRLDQTRG